MIKKYVFICTLIAAMCLNGCRISQKQNKETELVPIFDTEDAHPFIEEIAEEKWTENGLELAEEYYDTEDEYYVIEDTEGDIEIEGKKSNWDQAVFSVRERDSTKNDSLQTQTQDKALIEADTIVEETEEETEEEAEGENGPFQTILTNIISVREQIGEKWALSYEDLQTGISYSYNGKEKMQSASVIKLFIMGAVYQYMCYPENEEERIEYGETYDGELRATLEAMITVSDNEAANLLIERMGEGDFQTGAARINNFCQENGYKSTTIGRRFLESNPSGDNYTSAEDTGKFLSDLYNLTLVNEEASRKMLDIVCSQTRKNKIPAGLPEGFSSGNKTGEMTEGYGLGCIENDAAIIFPPEGEGEGYVLIVMSNELSGRNSEAINIIVEISEEVAQWYLQRRNNSY